MRKVRCQRCEVSLTWYADRIVGFCARCNDQRMDDGLSDPTHCVTSNLYCLRDL